MARDVNQILALQQAPRQNHQLQHDGLVLVERLLEVVLVERLLEVVLGQLGGDAHHNVWPEM